MYMHVKSYIMARKVIVLYNNTSPLAKLEAKHLPADHNYVSATVCMKCVTVTFLVALASCIYQY